MRLDPRHDRAELDRRVPDRAGPRERLIRFVTDRPGHDFRYEIDPSRCEQALSWKPGALLGQRMRNGLASKCVASGGASFVTVVKTADFVWRAMSWK